MNDHTDPVPLSSHNLDGDHPRSRAVNTLRLLILLVATSLVVASIAAGVLVEVCHRLAGAGH